MTDLRRNACPSLAAPMQTGDGLLVRLGFRAGGVAPSALADIARAAETYGNGVLEVTRRGSLQVRGLRAETAPAFAAAITALDVPLRGQVPVETGPLAGVDALEIADARVLSEIVEGQIAALGLESRLGPKVSVVIDGGGQITLADVLADVRLDARRAHGQVLWQLSVGGTARSARPVGAYGAEGAVATTLEILQAIAALGGLGRAKALPDSTVEAIRHDAPVHGAAFDMPRAGDDICQNQCIGRFGLASGQMAVGIGLPFGQASSAQMIALAADVERLGCVSLRFAPERAMLLELGVAATASELERAAEAHSFVTSVNDPRLGMIACAGAPACASAHISTKDIARDIAMSLSHHAGEPAQLHISGCEKGCAAPAVSTASIVGIPGAEAELRDADGKVLARVAEKDVAAAFERVTIGADGQDTVYATAGTTRSAIARNAQTTTRQRSKRAAGSRYGKGE